MARKSVVVVRRQCDFRGSLREGTDPWNLYFALSRHVEMKLRICSEPSKNAAAVKYAVSCTQETTIGSEYVVTRRTRRLDEKEGRNSRFRIRK